MFFRLFNDNFFLFKYCIFSVMNVVKKKHVSLVLGSGGARGIAEIGVIHALEAKGYTIDEIVGCSIGSLVGGVYAQQKLPDFQDWLKTLSKREIFRLMDFTYFGSGVMKGIRIFEVIKQIVPDINIEDLPLRYTAVATDLKKEQDVVFRTGSMYDAIRASIAIPAVFTAVSIDEQFLVDGGVLNPLPINHVQHKHNLVVAVNLDGQPDPELVQTKNKSVKVNSIGVLTHAYYAMRRQLAAQSIALYKPDCVVTIPHNISGLWDYDRSEYLIEKGALLTENALSDL